MMREMDRGQPRSSGRWHTGVHALALVLGAAPRPTHATTITQVSGDCSINVVGDHNRVTLVCPMVLGKYVRREMRRRGQIDADHERRLQELEEARRQGDRQSAELEVALRAKNVEILASNDAVREQTEKNLERAAQLDQTAQRIPNPATRKAARSALQDGDLKSAEDIIYHTEAYPDHLHLHVGARFSLVSDQPIGYSGYGIGLFVMGNTATVVHRRAVSLTIPFSMDLLLGQANLGQEDQGQFFLSFALRAGPRLRLGSPISVNLGVYYDFPVAMYSAGGAYAPLLGIAADLGLQYKILGFTVLYRYDFNHVRYSDRPDLSFLGFGLSLLLTN